MLCAISNAVPEDPVVSIKSGHVFERSLIEKYILQHSTCPITRQPLSNDDLIAVKAGKPVKPRHTPSMSIPGQLGILSKEYDVLMLETFELRKQLETSRKELATSLYQHDASCRVITRLRLEKEQAERQLEVARDRFAAAEKQAAAVGGSSEGGAAKRARVAEGPPGLTEAQLEEINAKQKKLFDMRKNRVVDVQGLATPEEMANLSVSSTLPLHSTTPKQKGILSIACSPFEPSAEPALIATGGVDHKIIVHDTSSGVRAAELSGHAKKVSALSFAGARTIVSGSSDGVIKTWRASEDGAWAQASSALTDLGGAIVSVRTHPAPSYAVVASANARWQMLDIEAEKVLWDVRDEGAEGYLCASVHPDGHFVATGGRVGGLRVFDCRSSELLMSFDAGVEGAVQDVSFNENGIWAALACDAGVLVYDLRKAKCVLSFQPFEDATTSCLSWDHSGKYLACGGPSFKVYEVVGRKKGKGTEAHVLKTEVSKLGVNGLAFAQNAHSLYVAASDHNLRKYTCPQGVQAAT